MTRFSLKLGTLPLLGTLWPGQRTTLSPLLPEGDRQEKEKVSGVLNTAGLLDSSGCIISPLQEVLPVLATASRTVAADFMRPDIFHTVLLYYSKSERETFTRIQDTTVDETGFVNLDLQELIAFCDIGELETNRLFVPFDYTLDVAEARILTAMLDGERIGTRNAVIGAPDPADIVIRPAVQVPAVIEKRIAAAAHDPGDLIFLGLQNGSTGTLQRGDTPAEKRDYTDLVNRGLIRQSGKGYELAEQLLSLARRSVFMDMAATICTREIDDDGSLREENGYCIRADGMLFWFIAAADNPDRILLKYLPADRLSEILRHLFFMPFRSLSQIIVPPVLPQSGPRVCPQCGVQLTEGKKFCGTCGTQVP